jgi:SAM-dependent methyltransferase
MDLAAEFAKRAPWITHFVIEGVDSGGTFYALNDARISQFFECFPGVRTILELGSLEGGQTIAMSRHAGVERIVALETRAANIEKARFVVSLLGVSNVEFQQANLEHFDLAGLGNFDVVFCCGLLYHLTQPWKLLAQVAQTAPLLYLWTHYANEDEANLEIDGLWGYNHLEGGIDDPLSGLSSTSFWLALPSLLEALKRSGYNKVDILQIAQTPNGPVVSLAASQTNR